MPAITRPSNKAIYYTLKSLKILAIVVLVLFIGAYLYVTANKKKLIAQVTEQISEKLNGQVTIGDADITFFRSFPRIAVHVTNIEVRDTMFASHKHPFFKAKDNFFNINIFRLIAKKSPLKSLRIQDGSIYLFTDTSGYTNTYLLKGKKDPSGGPKKTAADISLNKIDLKNVRIILDDRKKEKLHDFQVDNLSVGLEDDGTDLFLSNDADMLVHSLAFNIPRGTFLKESTFTGDFKMKYGKVSQLLSFDSIDIKLAGQPFNLSGKFDLGDKNPEFSLRVHVRKADYERVKKLLPRRIDSSLSMVALDKPLDADAILHGPLRGGEPYIFANWNVKKSTLATPFLDFDDASFTGFYMNEVVAGLPRKDPNSVISISNFTASWHGLPVQSKNIQILNLTIPELTCDLHSSFPLKALNDIIPTNSLQLNSGDAAIVLNYKGPIQRNNMTNSFLNGSILFRNGNIMYTPRNVEMKALTGTLLFNNSNVYLKDLQCTVLENKIVMNGTANNILTLINTEPNRVKIDYNIYSPSLNLGAFTFLLKNRNKVTVAKKEDKKSFNKMAGQIDNMLEQSRVDVSLRAGNVVYRKFSANNLDANISLLQDRYLLNNISMNTAGGSMKLSGQLLNAGGQQHQATLNSTLTNVDVQKIFYAFNNFGQDGITSQSLEGILTSTANIAIRMDETGKVLPSSANGSVSFSLKNGALNNYEPIKKLQSFIFKNRDFDNIRFAELKDRLDISNGEIKINRMEIQSSVMSLYVEGLYSQRGNTDISVQVPLNNLKKRAEDYNPENIGTDKKVGRSIFLRGRPGSDGNVKFKLDLFNKFNKENK
ncbi:MAG: AsmA family protein [Ferruginibacter sp.]|nr:AsmA family protein [Ferruginibacter sp.]